MRHPASQIYKSRVEHLVERLAHKVQQPATVLTLAPGKDLDQLGAHKLIKGLLRAPLLPDGCEHVGLVRGLEGARLTTAEFEQRLDLIV